MNLDIGQSLVLYFWLSLIALTVLAFAIFGVIQSYVKVKRYRKRQRMKKLKLYQGGRKL